MDRRAFLSVVGSIPLTGCLGFFGPRETAAASEPETVTPDATGYDADADPGFDGNPLWVVALDVPETHDAGRPLPVQARIRNEDTKARDVSVTIAVRALDSSEPLDSLEYSGTVDGGSTLTLDVELGAPPEPGTYRVTIGDPDAPAAAKDVSVE